MVQLQQLSDTLVADAVLAGQDQRVGEELLADRADQLPLDVLDRDLSNGHAVTEKLPHLRRCACCVQPQLQSSSFNVGNDLMGQKVKTKVKVVGGNNGSL